MNKRIVILPFALALIASCNVSEQRESSIEEQEQAALDERNLAVEIVSDYRLITYDRPLDETADVDFIDARTLSAMKESEYYKKE